MKKIIRFILISFFLVINCVSNAFARNQAFVVPKGMEGRVNFWVNVFTKYGKHHYVLHHRAYPQVVFKVLDFNVYTHSMSANQLERYKEQVKRNEVKKILNMVKGFSLGRNPQNSFEREIYTKLINLPGGKNNFEKVYKDELVRAQAGIKEEYIEALKRSGRYISIMEKIFANEYHLPIELTRLPFVESSFNYKAYSAVGAAGIWQFMRRTGASMGMVINNAVDERRDPVIATRAAAKYLRSNYRTLGSWALAITAYNHGAAGVARKVKEYGSNNIAYMVEHPTKRLLGFASNNFYAEFLAALEVYENMNKYFPGIRQEPSLQFLQYPLHYPIKVTEVSKRLNLSVDAIQKYNYSLTNKTLAGYYLIPKGFKIKLPREYVNKLSLLNTPDKSAKYVASKPAWEISPRYYTVRRGDSLGSISNRLNISVSNLKKINGLKSDRITVGQRLLVNNNGGASSNTVTKTITNKVTYIVKRGDTLIGISKKYKVSIEDIKRYNGLKGNIVNIGQKLQIPVTSKITYNPTKAQATSFTSSFSYYTVKKGDTLLSIALKYKTNVKYLKSINNLRSDALKIGQKLKVPSLNSTGKWWGAPKAQSSSRRSYKVQKGDSLWGIANKYKVTVGNLKKANKITTNSVKLGQTLIIP